MAKAPLKAPLSFNPDIRPEMQTIQYSISSFPRPQPGSGVA